MMNVNTTEELLDYKPTIDRYLNESQSNLSSFSFVNIFAWQEFFQFDLKVIQDCLCIFAKSPIGRFLYLPPLGKNVTSKVIEECFGIMDQKNEGSGVTRIENVTSVLMPLFPEGQHSFFKKGYEYCYYRSDITESKGKSFHSKRSSYNQFVNTYEHCFVSYEESMLEECLSLYCEWSKDRQSRNSDDIYCHMIDENEKVHELVLKNFRELDLIGRVVKVDGQIKAYSFGYEVNDNMFCILFEVTDIDVRGISTYIFKEFCSDQELNRYQFINVMDDLGTENIHKTKMSFRPCLLLPSFTATKKRNVL